MSYLNQQRGPQSPGNFRSHSSRNLETTKNSIRHLNRPYQWLVLVDSNVSTGSSRTEDFPIIPCLGSYLLYAPWYPTIPNSRKEAVLRWRSVEVEEMSCFEMTQFGRGTSTLRSFVLPCSIITYTTYTIHNPQITTQIFFYKYEGLDSSFGDSCPSI
jgi:hypothetical protein